MKVAFFDLKRLYRLTEHDVDREIRHVLESGHYILGNECLKFEAALKESLVGAAPGYALGCNSGTDALVLSMLALDIGPGDEVISVSHTAIPTITAIRATGATPVFCDIDPKTWLLDVRHVSDLITPETKAIIAVHLYGNLVNISELRAVLDLADRKDIKIIEDCAQAQGSMWHKIGQNIAAGSLGDFAAFSFYPTKNIGAIGDGGAVFTKDAAVAEKMRMLRYYGQKDRYNALIDRGINSRLDEIQAAILNGRIKYLTKWAEKKAGMVAHYQHGLSGLPIEFQSVNMDVIPNWHLTVVKNKSKKSRDQILTELAELGAQCLIHYPIPTHTQEAFSLYANGPLPHTEELAKEIFSLPMNPAILPEEIEHVIKCMKRVLS